MRGQRYRVIIGGADPALQPLQASLDRVFAQIEADLMAPYLAKAKLPGSGFPNVAMVTDEAGGEVLAFRDSAGAWRRATDRAVVS